MKGLVVYYSRTGTTKKVAETIQGILGCDIEQVLDTKNRSGIWGWLRSGRDAGSRKLTRIIPVKNDAGSYELVIIGTPAWNGSISTPIRTYIEQYKQLFQEVAFFCTHISAGDAVLKELEILCDKKPVASIKLSGKHDVQTGAYLDKVQQFVNSIRKQMNR